MDVTPVKRDRDQIASWITRLYDSPRHLSNRFKARSGRSQCAGGSSIVQQSLREAGCATKQSQPKLGIASLHPAKNMPDCARNETLFFVQKSGRACDKDRPDFGRKSGDGRLCQQFRLGCGHHGRIWVCIEQSYLLQLSPLVFQAAGNAEQVLHHAQGARGSRRRGLVGQMAACNQDSTLCATSVSRIKSI